jgi:hypothetical protein
MDERTLGVVTSPSLQHDWLKLARQAGADARGYLLHTALPRWQPDGWLVVLDPRQPPVPLTFWLTQLSAPVILVTPHLVAAQTLCGHGSTLTLLCDPLRAAADLADLLALALAVTSGTLVLTAPAADPVLQGNFQWS